MTKSEHSELSNRSARSISNRWSKVGFPARAHVSCCVLGCTVLIVDTSRVATYDRYTRNISKHHKTNGTLKLAARDDVIKEIDRQLDMGVGSLPAKCKCLLEISEEAR